MAQGTTTLQYPTNIDIYATYEDDIDICVAKMFNDLSSSIITIETKLGSNPQGSYTNVKDRIVALENSGFIKAGGTIALTANWDAGSYKITALQLESDIVTGTAPFVVASTTVVTNLNADTVDGIHGTDFVKTAGTVPLTANWDAGSYKITALQLESDIVTGTAPLVVASTTNVTNLSADMLDGLHDTAFVKAGGTVALSANWDAGSYKITSSQFESDIVTGTSPFVVASTTVVTNLNADLIDGVHSTGFLLAGGTVALTANWDAGAYKITALQLESDVATGTAPLVVASTTVVTNLNADLIDGVHSTGFLLAGGTVALTANWDAGAYKITALQLESDVATGTAPLVIASTTAVTNLNADMLDGIHSSGFAVSADIVPIGYLRPTAQSVPDNTVAVAAGTYIKSDGTAKFVFAGGNSPTFPVVTANSRIDLLCITDTGTLTIVSGTQSITPVAPTYATDKLPIAEITIDETGTVVVNTADIRDVRPFLNLGGGVSDTAYGVSWDGVVSTAPSKNAVYDKIEAVVSDTAYAGSWDGVTTIAPSKNAVYDKIETVGKIAVAQATHGFAVGDLLYLNGSTYTKAIATSAAASEVIGIVSTVTDGNNFIITLPGNKITGLSSLTAGTVYFLSDVTAGLLTSTEPTTYRNISKPVLIADSTTSGLFVNYRGAEVIN